MQEPEPRSYFERRSEQELAAAERAVDARAAQSHRELADHYCKLANGSERLPTDEDDSAKNGILPKDFSILP